VPALDASELLAAYDAQLRGLLPARLPAGVEVERDGPLLRFLGRQRRGFIDYRDLGAVRGAELDALIARQVRVFAERAEPFEWKTRGHDEPADLPQRLAAAGFVPEGAETVLIAAVAEVAAEPRPPEGVTLREVSDRRDLRRIEAMEQAIWHEDESRLADRLEAERAVAPDELVVVTAEAGRRVVCAGWVRFETGSDFATLWGGGTLPEWRGRGIYRSMVAYRAQLARERGCRYLEVDASDESRPILERLGFVAVTTTTPFVWSP
jgi:GNAT superfamily N-acetyltransferase